MRRASLAFLTGALLLQLIAAGPAAAAEREAAFPLRPVTIILPYTPGGDMDRFGRLIAEHLRQRWNQPVLFQNFGGAGGEIGSAMVCNAAPDGYTLLFGATAQIVTNKFLYARQSYDPDAFTPIALVSTSSFVLVAYPGFAANDIPQLLALARSRPGKISYVSGGVGTSTHLATELLSSAANVRLLHVPYKSSSQGLTDVLAGNVDIGLFSPGLVSGHIQTGRLKILAVGSSGPNPLFPGVSAISATVPGIVALSWYALVAPPGTPAPVSAKISSDVAAVLKASDVLRTTAELNIDPVGSTPAQLADFLRDERRRWGPLIRAKGIKAE